MSSFILEGVVFLSGLILCYCLKEIIATSKSFSWIPEASLLIFGGFLTIFLFYSIGYVDLQFNPTFFYYCLLPPIIFNTGLDIDFNSFISNSFAIMLYANIGTLINCLLVCLILYLLGRAGISTGISIAEGVAFGSLISATDPVTTLVVLEKFKVEHNLFGIILAVSILDDAVAVLSFQLCNTLIGSGAFTAEECLLLLGKFITKFFGSILFGYFSGLGLSSLIKYISNRTNQDRSSQMICLLLLFNYLTFFLAEVCWLSGIISVLYAAMYWKKHDKISPDIEVRRKAVVAGVAMSCESITFYLIGLSLLSHPLKTVEDWGFFGWSFVACIVGRALQVYPLAQIVNYFKNFTPSSLRHTELSMESTHQDEERADEIMESVRLRPRGNSISSHTVDQGHSSWIPFNELLCPNPRTGATLPLGYQHMILLAGLRGPIAYSTAQLFNDAEGHLNLIAGSTAMTVVFTTFLFGSLTVPALKWFKIPYEADDKADSPIPIRNTVQEDRIGDNDDPHDVELVVVRKDDGSYKLEENFERSFTHVAEQFSRIVAHVAEEKEIRK